MFHSVLSRTSIRVLLAAAVVLLIFAVVFSFTQRQDATVQVPVTGAQDNSAASQPIQAVQKQDIGDGYTLETQGQDAHIVAPEIVLRSEPSSQTLDLGAGYVLRDGKIIAPAANLKADPVTVQKLDLGAGYTLESDNQGTRIVAPAANLKAEPVAVQKLDLGAGYSLETDSQGTRIVAPETNLKGQSSGQVQKIDLGGGYWLMLGPDSGQIVSESSQNH